MVVTFLPDTAETGKTQERWGSPLICTVQAPHAAMPHPYFVPVRFSVSRSTQSSGVSGLTSTVREWPFTSKVPAIKLHLSQETTFLYRLPSSRSDRFPSEYRQ